MGWIHDRHMKSSGSLNRDPSNNGSQSGPLRKIIGTCTVNYTQMEALECGHLQMPKSDIMGETAVARRRCKHCKAGRPVHFTGNPPSEMTTVEYERVYQKGDK